MTQEEKDFIHFKDAQLYQFNSITGQIDAIKPNTKRIYRDIGSTNEDGYVRVWCNGKLRMKHRLVYFLVHGIIPKDGEEIDHIDSNRGNNVPTNLRILTKPQNNKGCSNRKFGKQLTITQVHEICKLLSQTDMSDLQIAEAVGRSRCTIRDIKTRRTRTSISNQYTWAHRGY